MSPTRPFHFARRSLLGLPAVVVAATTLAARPAQAKPEKSQSKVFECAADLFGGS